jgi:cell division protein FtsB
VDLKTMKESAQKWASRFYGGRRKLATAAVAALAMIMAYHVIFGVNGLLAYQGKREESKDLQRQIESLQQQKGGLEQQIKALKNDPKAIEKEAREQLRYVRPGEKVFTLPAPQSGASPSGSK